MAVEIDEINAMLRSQNQKYVLIAPGRWGSSDRFLGIPVVWSQITGAAVIVEVVLPNMSIEASHGSHFFHNLFSMGVAYLTVRDNHPGDHMDWQWIDGLASIDERKYFEVKKTPAPLKILFDGKNAVIKRE